MSQASRPAFKLPSLPRPFDVLVPVCLVFGMPFLAWVATPDTLLAVLVIDKTVAATTYREHSGLMWALNHLKIVPRRGEAPLHYDKDYVGFFPKPDHQFTIKPIPVQPGAYDMVYFADTYGVYEADLNGTNARGIRSKLLYGGLEASEVEAAKADLAPGGTLIGEFNMFASPTRYPGKAAATAMFGLHWGGWVGRYFPELRPDGEVPTWLVSSFEQQNKQPYTFTGNGFAFANDDGRVEVLRMPLDVGADALKIHFKDAAHFGVADATDYDYWFDVVTPLPGTEVIANYRLDASPADAARLARVGLPVEFPAVLRRRQHGSTFYYFAGDYADNEDVPDRWRLWGMAWMFQVMTPNDPTRPEAFYWRVYVPMMNTICHETAIARDLPEGGDPR